MYISRHAREGSSRYPMSEIELTFDFCYGKYPDLLTSKRLIVNTLKKLASIFALVSAIGVTSCKSGNEVRGIDQPDTYAKILAKYSISESTAVAEFRSISNPNYIIVATDGNHASGIAT